MREEVREYAESKGLEENLNMVSAGEREADFTDFIFDGIAKAREMLSKAEQEWGNRYRESESIDFIEKGCIKGVCRIKST